MFRHFIGGLQTYLPNVALLLAPYVNSYRRFTRYMAAPINLQWGYDNRTVGLRVPETGPQDRRVENRVAGSDVNPYLAIAASLACGYLGMEEKLEPSPPETGNAYRRPFALPRTLNESLERLERNERMRLAAGRALRAGLRGDQARGVGAVLRGDQPLGAGVPAAECLNMLGGPLGGAPKSLPDTRFGRGPAATTEDRCST